MFDNKYMCWAVFNYSPICRALPSLLEKFLRAAGTPRFWLQQLGSGWLESTKRKITTLGLGKTLNPHASLLAGTTPQLLDLLFLGAVRLSLAWPGQDSALSGENI